MKTLDAKVEAIIKGLDGTHVAFEAPDADQRIAAYWWGQPDEEAAWALSMAKLIAAEPVAQSIYLARVANDSRGNRAIKEWAYNAAVEFAGSRGSAQRKRSMVESYRTDWGHQAARDGVARALFPEMVDEMPGRDARCKQFKCGHQAYQRVRDEIMRQALDLFVDFRSDIDALLTNKWSRAMICRWERATGANWADQRG